VNVSPAPTRLAYFLPDGQAWALSSQNPDGIILDHSTDWGTTWNRLRLSFPTGDWWPTQLHFTSPGVGWMVVQQMTSQVFSSAKVMKTTDSGVTWQSYDLPMAGEVSFTSPVNGWLQASAEDQLFYTIDGGLTWMPAERSGYPLSQSTHPDGTTLSGWQTSSTGWAATSQGECTGEKFTPAFTCQVERALWQTLDGGQSWSAIPLPVNIPVKH
jgi:photosystem II stability/assembly factor-like uncharacterized protein